MGELSQYPNIGPEVEKQLHRAGIDSMEQLKQVGSREAWLRIQAFDASACANRLYSLEGAIRGIPKKQLDDATKAALKAFYAQHRLPRD